MKKYISGLLIVLSFLVYLPAKAATPQLDGLFGLGDVNTQISYYDVNSIWKYYCFTGNCYDITTDKLAFVKDIEPVIANLNQKIDQLQNTVNQLQQPTIIVGAVPQATSTSVVKQNFFANHNLQESIGNDRVGYIVPNIPGLTATLTVINPLTGETLTNHSTYSSTKQYIYVEVIGLKSKTTYNYDVTVDNDTYTGAWSSTSNTQPISFTTY